MKKKVLFHQDNARVHTCLVTMAKIHELRYELLPHPAYSPDLAPCDYYLFPNLKKWLGGLNFFFVDVKHLNARWTGVKPRRLEIQEALGFGLRRLRLALCAGRGDIALT
ncbi:Histone-lysine N-methyltransferase SETMAR [Eumeta japonica]|uniref:Histone-lysine N-methyltransferase SETMAR n=1 Tax=Eumeta variegata TaxID=151549 RepID=A0A4C1ZA43_EUMVA|nr:Histone-lysine N-methyltransferase SETMAR [Eumeta japonica]